MPSDKLSFVRKPVKHGTNDFIFTIPREYMRKELIDPNQKYKISIEPFRDQKEHILKIIAALEEKLAFGHIDQETYYKLIKKYEEQLF